jgi:uncharacterized protein YeaO (DUF488 family)
MGKIKIKRIYDEPSDDDGYRVLVDRLWPRGISKKNANLDEWNKEIAPSPELRKWFDHKEERFKEFTLRYQLELKEKEEQLNVIRQTAKHESVSLLYAAKNHEINHAIVLKDALEKNG